jgi:hypothetical protein
MNIDELVATLESKTGDDFVVELSACVFRPPLSELRDDRLPELPTALRTALLLIRFDTETIMGGLGGFLDVSTGRELDGTIEALETIGARSTAGKLAKVRAILARHRIDLGDEAGIHWSRTEDSEAEIAAESDNLRYEDREDVIVMLPRYVEDNRDALLQAIRTCIGHGAA